MRALEHESIKNRFELLGGRLKEKERRLWAGAEALALGFGGVSAVARATGLSALTVQRGVDELSASALASSQGVESSTVGDDRDRQRASGGGRKALLVRSPGLADALERLMEPYTSGDPMRPLRWSCKSTAELARELRRQGHRVCADSVGNLLKANGYSLQSNRKRFEGRQHADRNAQFEHISSCVEAFQQRGSPTISVDAKKKELVGNYRNAGREWAPQGRPHEVEVYDFIDADKGKVTPYGIYDTSRNLGWVSVGTDHDTAQFAVRSIRRWWEEMGEWLYPNAREILIMADGGGSNSSRNRLWKKSLQEWANQERLRLMVCHFPPGTSKWNKIEHRMFCHITRNWRGKPLVSHEVIIELIGATTTEEGLSIHAELDANSYPTGIHVSDDDMDRLNITHSEFHGEWNYLIQPQSEVL